MKRRIILILLLTVLILTTAGIEQDEQGGWNILGPGVEVIYLPARPQPAIWFYLAGYLVWHYQPEPPLKVPVTPRPELLRPVTPTPAGLELRQI